MITKLTLTTWDRLTLTAVIGRRNGDARFIRKAGKLLDAIELTQAERDAVNFRRDESGEFFVWDDEPVKTYDIEVADPDASATLKQIVSSEDKWVVGEHSKLVALFDRLGID